MSEKTKNIILVAILLALIFIAYSLFFNKDAKEGALMRESAVSEGGSGVVGEFLALLHTLNNLELNTRILTDSAYRSLRDESVELISQPQGRKNPFAPLQ